MSDERSAPSLPLPAHPTAPDDDETEYRDIHALTPAATPAARPLPRLSSWDSTLTHHSSAGALSDEQLMTLSREFTAMVAAGSTMQNPDDSNGGGAHNSDTSLARIGEDELEETNPLAIVPEMNPVASPRSSLRDRMAGESSSALVPVEEVSVAQVRKEEVESKVAAWQTTEMAKINNRFKREEVEITGWESEQVEKATATLKKIERKLEEQRAKAVEKAQNDVAKARRKAEERRASAEAKKGLKLAKVFELANFMKAIGRVPTKRSFF